MEESSKTAVLVRSLSAPADVQQAFLPRCHTVALRLVLILWKHVRINEVVTSTNHYEMQTIDLSS